MEVHLTPELEAKLSRLAEETGRPAAHLVEDVMTGYVEELTEVREMLNRRYEEVDSGKVRPLDGEEAFARLRRKSQRRRARRS